MGTQSSALDGHGQVQSPEWQAATTPRPRAPSPQLSSISDYESEDEIEERLKREAAAGKRSTKRVERIASQTKGKVRERKKKLAKKRKRAAVKSSNHTVPSDAENPSVPVAVEEAQKEKQEDTGVPSVATDARAARFELGEAEEEQHNLQDLSTARLTNAKILDQSDDEVEGSEQSIDAAPSKLSALKRPITPELEARAELEAREESEDSEGDEEAAAVQSLNTAIRNTYKRKREEPLDDDHEVHDDFSPAVFRKRQPLKDSSKARALTQVLQEAAEHGSNPSSDEPFAKRTRLTWRSSGVSTPQEPNGEPVASESGNSGLGDEPSRVRNPKAASPTAAVRHLPNADLGTDSDSSVPFDALADDRLDDAMDDALDTNEPGFSNEAVSPAVQSLANRDDRQQPRNDPASAENDDIDPVTGAPYTLLLHPAHVIEDDVTTSSEIEQEDPNEDVFEGMRSSGDADTMDLKDALVSSDDSTSPSSGSAPANLREVNSIKTTPGQLPRNKSKSDLRQQTSAVASQDNLHVASKHVIDNAEKVITDVVPKVTPSGSSGREEEAGRLEQPEPDHEDVAAVEEDGIMDDGGEEVQGVEEEERSEQGMQKSGQERTARRGVYDLPVAEVARESSPAIDNSLTIDNPVTSVTLPNLERLADESADEDPRPLKTAATVKRRSTKRKPKPVLQLLSESEPSLAKTSTSDPVELSRAAESVEIQASQSPVLRDDGPSAIELLHELPGDDLFDDLPPRQARSIGHALSRKRKIFAAMKGKGVDRSDSNRGSGKEEQEAGTLVLDSDIKEFQTPGLRVGSQQQSRNRQRAMSGKRGTLTDAEIQAIDRAVNAFRDDHGLVQEAVNDMIQSKNPKHGSKEVKELWTRIREAVPDQGSQKVVDLCRRIYHNFVARGRWTPDQDEELRYMVGRYGKAWSKIGELINRHQQDCRIRWRDYVQYGDMKRTSNWDQEEESELMTYLQEGLQMVQGLRREERRNDPLLAARSDEELIDWNVISKSMGGRRSAHQCREKYKRWRDAGLLSGDISQLEPPSSSKRLEKVGMAIRKIDVNDKLRLVHAIRESGVGKDELIPWRHIVKVEFGNRFQRLALQLLWSRLRQVVPNQEFMATRSIAEALIEDWDDEYRNYDELLNDDAVKDKAVITRASGYRSQKRSSLRQTPRSRSILKPDDSPETPSRTSMAHGLTHVASADRARIASSSSSQIQARSNLILRPSGSGSVASSQAASKNARHNAFKAISQTPTSAQPRNSLSIRPGHRSNVGATRNGQSRTEAFTGSKFRPLDAASQHAAAEQLSPTRRSLASGLILGGQRNPRSKAEAISDSEPDIGSRATKSPKLKAKGQAAKRASSGNSISNAIQAIGSPASSRYVNKQASVDLGAESEDDALEARQASPDLSAPENAQDSTVDSRSALQQAVSAPPNTMPPARKTLDQDVVESLPSNIVEASSKAVPESPASQPRKKLTARWTAHQTPVWAALLKMKESKDGKVSPAAKTESAGAVEPTAATTGSRKPASKKRARQSEPASPINLDDFKKTPRKKARMEAAKPPAGVRKTVSGSGKKSRTRPLDSSDEDSDMADIPARLPIDDEES
jgi:hypothetical protein